MSVNRQIKERLKQPQFEQFRKKLFQQIYYEGKSKQFKRNKIRPTNKKLKYQQFYQLNEIDNFNEDCIYETFEYIFTNALHDWFFLYYQFDNNLEYRFTTYQFISLKHFDLDDDLINPDLIKLIQESIIFQQISKKQTITNQLETNQLLYLMLVTLQDVFIKIQLCQKMHKTQKNLWGPMNFYQFQFTQLYMHLHKGPILIYFLLSLIYNKRNFRNSSLLSGYQQYYLTSYESAIQFISTLEQEYLKIDKEEYKKFYKQQNDLAKQLFQNDIRLEDLTQSQIDINLHPKMENYFSTGTEMTDLNQITHFKLENLIKNYQEQFKKAFNPFLHSKFNRDFNEIKFKESEFLIQNQLELINQIKFFKNNIHQFYKMQEQIQESLK